MCVHGVREDGIDLQGRNGRQDRAWGGLMSSINYDYFERDHVDIFSGRGPCLNAPICAVNVTSDGSGQHHGWYCSYIEVTTTGPGIPCAKKKFQVEQWLAMDTSPYKLWSVRNYCPNTVMDALPQAKRVGSGFSIFTSTLTTL